MIDGLIHIKKGNMHNSNMEQIIICNCA